MWIKIVLLYSVRYHWDNVAKVYNQNTMKKKQRILVAMSGGVDSSVAAALLVHEGYEVTGAFMKQWNDSGVLTGVCSWKQDRRDAMRVAAQLGIPLITFDFEKEYRDLVIEYLFREYEDGRIPNPDVLCNVHIKFGVWLKKAKELKFDALATGHYASIKKEQKYTLCIAKDKNKDQTYFLHRLNQEQLAFARFPISEYTKPEVRQKAYDWKLPTADRAESMGICFIGEVSMKQFLEQRITKKSGNIILSDGTVVGKHEGVAFYTIGQRHFGLQASDIVSQTYSGPLFIVEKRIDANELVVGFEDSPLLNKTDIIIKDAHWISGLSPVFPLYCTVRFRHREILKSCVLNQVSENKILIKTKLPERAPTPGQFAVFYDGGVCLGGGIIQ